ncbi:MAG: amidohydrolase family protein, partial [bacterium]
MSSDGHPTATQIRSRLSHPVIDGDGHWVEFDPVFGERMRKVGGDRAADGFLAAMQTTRDALSMPVAERKRRRIAQVAFWSRQAENTLDRATAMMPRLLYERLDEFGTDFAVVYPTAGLRLPRIGDDETRRAVIRAHNVVTAESFRQ